MESPVEIRYAGVVIGRAQEVQSAEGDSPLFFLVVRDPMPVGSVLHLRTGDRETPARVIRTVESSDSNACGIQVRLIGESEEVATEWIPPPAPVVEKTHAVVVPIQSAMPVIEVSSAEPQAEETSDQRPAPTQTSFDLSTTEATDDTAVPEAVPVTITSSMTVAPEDVADGTPPNGAEASASDEETTGTDGQTSGAAVSSEGVPTEDLPPARAISGPSGRRKTKRRR
jgi:hypothetical protein